MRTLYVKGSLLGLDLARLVCLPFKVIEEAHQVLKDEKCIEVAGGDLIGRVSYRFNLTELGRKRAPGIDEGVPIRRPRAGAARRLRRTNLPPSRHRHQLLAEPLKSAFGHLIIKDELFNAIGPAIISGRSIFIYGPPGNGKTAIARSIGEFMNNAGGEIYVPYAFIAEKQHRHALRHGRASTRRRQRLGPHRRQ